MHIHQPFEFKRMSECAAGDIFQFDLQGTSAFGLILEERTELDEAWAVAIAGTADDFRPTIFPLNEAWNDHCVSYGDASIEMLQEAVRMPTPDLRRHSSALRIRPGDGVLLYAHHLERRNGGRWINLASARFDNGDQRPWVDCTRWRIWGSVTDRGRDRAEPLITITEPLPF